MTPTQYKFVGDHVEDLADGRPLEPGQTVQLDRDALADPHNARLISDGKLLELEQRGSRKGAHDDKEGDS